MATAFHITFTEEETVFRAVWWILTEVSDQHAASIIVVESCSSETSLNINQTTRRQVPEDSSLLENLRSLTLRICHTHAAVR
jgi:hypothetical protein